MKLTGRARLVLLILVVPLSVGSAGEATAQPVETPGLQFGQRQPHPRPDGAIRLATYNIENVFDHANDPELEGEFDDAELGITVARAEAIAEAIRLIDADILAVQEIESLDALRWFRDTYLSDLGYDHIASMDVGYYRGIECAVLSRFEILDAKVRPNAPIDDVERVGIGWAEVPTNDPHTAMTIQRSPIMVRIRVSDAYELTVLSLHHKSGGNYKWKREAEALKIVEWLEHALQDDPSRNVVIMGDFNAAPWDKSLRVYLEAGFTDAMAYRTWRDEEGRLYKSHRSDRVLDYVLLNAPAFNEYVKGSGHIVGTYNPPDTWNWRTDPHPVGYAADHFPVIIDLTPENHN